VQADCPSSRFSALAAEDHPAQFVAKALGFIRISCVAKALSKFEKLLLFALLGLDAVLDEFDQHAVGAKPVES
jgi:hypothetical protein